LAAAPKKRECRSEKGVYFYWQTAAEQARANAVSSQRQCPVRDCGPRKQHAEEKGEKRRVGEREEGGGRERERESTGLIGLVELEILWLFPYTLLCVIVVEVVSLVSLLMATGEYNRGL
jgi:hypothetical protein